VELFFSVIADYSFILRLLLRRVKMKNKPNSAFSIGLAVLLIALIIAAMTGCDDGDFVLSVNQNVNAEQSASKNSSEVQNLSSEAYYYLASIASGISVSSNNCPLVTIDSFVTTGGMAYSITVDYGSAPCQSAFDSIRKSGKFEINGFINDARDSIYGSLTFPESSPLKVYKLSEGNDTNCVKVGGSNIFFGKRAGSSDIIFKGSYSINNTFTTNTGKTKSFSLNLSVNAQFHDPHTTSDDTFFLQGSGTITDNYYGLEFSYNIQNILKKTEYYRYPVSGKVKMLRINSSVSATTIDFHPNNDEEDDIVNIERGNFNTTVNLEPTDQ
jgi:hypothetical protein